MDLGHDLTRADIARGYWNRTVKASQEVLQVVRKHVNKQLDPRHRRGHR